MLKTPPPDVVYPKHSLQSIVIELIDASLGENCNCSLIISFMSGYLNNLTRRDVIVL